MFPSLAGCKNSDLSGYSSMTSTHKYQFDREHLVPSLSAPSPQEDSPAGGSLPSYKEVQGELPHFPFT